MALIRISLNNGKTAILFPEQYYRIFQALLNAAERDFEVSLSGIQQGLEDSVVLFREQDRCFAVVKGDSNESHLWSPPLVALKP